MLLDVLTHFVLASQRQSYVAGGRTSFREGGSSLGDMHWRCVVLGYDVGHMYRWFYLLLLMDGVVGLSHSELETIWVFPLLIVRCCLLVFNQLHVTLQGLLLLQRRVLLFQGQSGQVKLGLVKGLGVFHRNIIYVDFFVCDRNLTFHEVVVGLV